MAQMDMEIIYEKSWEDLIVCYIRNNKYRIKKGPIHDGAASQSVFVDGNPAGKFYFHKREPAAGFLGRWADYQEDCFEEKEIEFSEDGQHTISFYTMDDDVGEVALGAVELYGPAPEYEKKTRIEASELTPDSFGGTAKLHPGTQRTVVNLNAAETKRLGSSVTFKFPYEIKGKYKMRVYYYSRKKHGLYEIFYLFNGNGRYIVEGTDYKLTSGCMILLRSSETRQLVLSKDTVNEYVTIEFHPDFIKTIDPKRHLLEAFDQRPEGAFNLYLDKETPRELSRFIKGIAESNANDPYTARIKLAIELQMTLYLISEMHQARQKAGVMLESEDLVTKVMRYINKYLTDDISISTLAEVFYTSKSNLDYLFHKKNGYSIHSYILLKRLLMAQELLKNGVSANEVCNSCGFKEYTTFYRQYKKHFGVSPREEKG